MVLSALSAISSVRTWRNGRCQEGGLPDRLVDIYDFRYEFSGKVSRGTYCGKNTEAFENHFALKTTVDACSDAQLDAGYHFPTSCWYLGEVADDIWAGLADKFADEAYASVKGYVRTYVMHQHLLEYLPPTPAAVLDVGGGAGHQSFPLAQAGYDVTLLDRSQAMMDKAKQRLQQMPDEVQRRVTLLQADGENADEAVDGRRFAAVLCHGVLGYLEQPEPLVNQLCQCVAAGGVVSIMTGNALAGAVRPAMERRWSDALAAFDARTEIGVLGVQGRADTVDELSEIMRSQGVEPVQWYGVWLFVDWLEFSGAELDPSDKKQLAAIAAVELEASRRDPYRQLSRVFHLLGRKGPTA